MFQSIDDDGINRLPVMDLRYKALRDASRVRQLRRDYWQAIDIFNELRRWPRIHLWRLWRGSLS